MNPEDRRRRRSLNDEEHQLWHHVTRSVAPLKRKRAKSVRTVDAVEPRSETDRHKRPAGTIVRPVETKPARKSAAVPPQPPPLALLERRAKRRLARGHEEIAARIDLHGRTQSEAHAALLRFLMRAQHEQARFVLVITGKGGEAGRGVLRRQVPLWLSLPEFRPLVLGFETAHAGHGGEGALYIRIRRVRSG
jgi:DNA-nicking Smr family endonuclease